MLGFVTALAIGFLIASPQLWWALRYYPRSIRAGKTFEQKTELGNIPLWVQLRNMVVPSVDPVDGVFGPEACTFIGLPALFLILFAQNPFWWLVLLLSMSLSLGNRFPLFYRTSRLHLRIPARYCYFTSLALAFLALSTLEAPHWGASRASPLSPKEVSLLLLLQILSLILTLPKLWPMLPYVQRWERPSQVFSQPLVRFLSSLEGTSPTTEPNQTQEHAPRWRVSGLPYPLRTGQTNGIRTLGYNGGSQAQWMAHFRGDANPNGSGAHDWFALNEDGSLLDWYGVKYAYTYRPLAKRSPKWKQTPIPHLYENTQVQEPPSWEQMRSLYEPVR